VVWFKYRWSRCGEWPIVYYEQTWMPSYQGHTVTFYIGQ